MLGEIRAHMPGGGAVLPASGSAAILRASLWRWVFNLFPAFRGTGARVEYVDPEMREVRVRLPLHWRTRNLVGTIFDGSMYAAVDPFYALMQSLGPDYVVWDKAAVIHYRRLGRTTLYAWFTLGDEEIRGIREELAAGDTSGRGSVDRVYQVELTDAAGEVHAVIEKTLYVRLKYTARIGGGRESRAELKEEPEESQEEVA
jgi:hypothetical protein